MSGQMNDAGTETKFVQHIVDEEEKLSHQCQHNNKLAITSRLDSTTYGHTPLHIFKDMEVLLW